MYAIAMVKLNIYIYSKFFLVERAKHNLFALPDPF